MPGEFIPDPEWVMLGVSQPEGVVVFASRHLSMAELRHALDHFVDLNAFSFRNEFTKAWELSVTMRDVYWATGTDYGDAIRRLFNEWSPDARDQRALPSPAPPLVQHREEGVGWAKQPRGLPR